MSKAKNDPRLVYAVKERSTGRIWKVYLRKYDAERWVEQPYNGLTQFEVVAFVEQTAEVKP